MGYQKLKPADILKPYVESIWLQEDLTFDPDWQPTKIIPTGKADIIFYYHDPFVQHLDDNTTEKIPMTVLHSPITKPMRVSATGKTGLIIFSFYPWGIAPFIPIPLYELSNPSVDLKWVFGSHIIGELHSQIIESKNNLARINLIQDFLIKHLMENAIDRIALSLVHHINKNSGKIRIGLFEQHFHYSRRHLLRRFSTMTGLSPKQFAGIIRFQKALFLKRSGFHWSDIAEKCGYYDQSHFIKEIKQFSDSSPEKIYSGIKPTRLMNYFNSLESMSHFYNTIYL